MKKASIIKQWEEYALRLAQEVCYTGINTKAHYAKLYVKKATCLWLNGLPKLQPTNIVEGRSPRVHHCPPCGQVERAKPDIYWNCGSYEFSVGR